MPIRYRKARSEEWQNVFIIRLPALIGETWIMPRRELWAHAEHAKVNLIVKDCWFCHHQAGEHLDHDFIVAKCPDCANNLAMSARHQQYLAEVAARRHPA